MEKNKERLFVVLEEHLKHRYLYMISKYDFISYSVKNLNHLSFNTSLKLILKRIKHRKIVKQEYLKLKEWVILKGSSHDIEQIYMSNVEGFIAHNIIKNLRKDFPNYEIIGLQHGIFEFSLKPKSLSRRLINNFIKVFFDIYPIGVGFGGKIVDKYIVYNKVYRDFLISKFNWNKKDIEINLELLKAELLDKKRQYKLNNNKTALFLLQCYSKAGLCTKQEEENLNDKIIHYLSNKYEKILLKNHPASNFELKKYVNDKIEVVDDLIQGFLISSFVYSYASTGLFEADIFGLETYAIDSNIVKEDKSIYRLFKNVLNFEKDIEN